MADLKLTVVSKSFGPQTAVSDLHIDIASGEFVVLLGPSGAGKTTTLRLVAGLEKPDTGTVWIDGRDVTAMAPALRDVTFVFQQYSLYPHLNVYDNLAFPLRSPLRKISEEQVRAKVQEVARMLQRHRYRPLLGFLASAAAAGDGSACLSGGGTRLRERAPRPSRHDAHSLAAERDARRSAKRKLRQP
jgi:ABC-type lipopolysaccharide export system ATPase subunit